MEVNVLFGDAFSFKVQSKRNVNSTKTKKKQDTDAFFHYVNIEISFQFDA